MQKYNFFCERQNESALFSKFHQDTGIYHAAREVVGDGVLVVRDVGYPVVAADVVEAEDVETVQPEPDIAQHVAAAQVMVFIVDEAVVRL